MNLARFGPECRDAIHALEFRCRELAAALSVLRSARPFDAGALATHLNEATALADGVRARVSAAAEALGCPVPEWAAPEELAAVVERFDLALAELGRRDQRKRLAALAGALRAGRFVNPKTGKTLTAYEPLRVAAAEELGAGPGEGAAPFPGPADAGEWLAWAWDDPETAEARLGDLRPWAPTLVQLLLETDPTHWAPGDGAPLAKPAPVPAAPAVPVAPATPAAPAASAAPAPPEPAVLPAPAAPREAAPTRAPRSGPVVRYKNPFRPDAPPPRGGTVTGLNKISLLKSLISAPPRRAPRTAAKTPVAPGTTPPSEADARAAPVPEAPEDAGLPPEFDPIEVPDALVVDEAEPAHVPAPVLLGRPEPEPPAPAAEPEPERPLRLADADEVVALCASGEYLRAALLGAGRLFAGEPELDPRVDALVVAQHVTRDALTVPWPAWSLDPEGAGGVARAAPESARTVFLASRCHAAADGAADPLPPAAADALLGAFNDLSEVRNWLAQYLEVAAVPGLWDQVCKPAGPGPFDEYLERRRAFAVLYETGLQHRNPNAAYIHRQALFVCRKPGAKALFDHVPVTGPKPPAADARDTIERFLRLQPPAVTGDWIATTERVGGGVRLHGNQRADLISHAAGFLSVANAAWKAAQVVLQNPVQGGDLDRRRKHLTETARGALARAAGRPWLPLLHRLTRGLPL